jgi:hypothetical protein
MDNDSEQPGPVNDNYIYPLTTIRNAYGAC